MLKKDAVRHFGSEYRLAKALKIHQSSVSRWAKRIPPSRAAQIEHLTGGKLRYDPKLYFGSPR